MIDAYGLCLQCSQRDVGVATRIRTYDAYSPTVQHTSHELSYVFVSRWAERVHFEATRRDGTGWVETWCGTSAGGSFSLCISYAYSLYHGQWIDALFWVKMILHV